MRNHLKTTLQSFRQTRLAVCWAICGFALAVLSQSALGQFVDVSAVTAEIRAWQPVVLAGHPVWVDFSFHNPTKEVAVLFMTGAKALDLNPPEMGLPLDHILGRDNDKTLEVRNERGKELAMHRQEEMPETSIAIRLSPHASVGMRVDLSLYCLGLQQPGVYEVHWRPYNGAVSSNLISIKVVALKQARIETDYGAITVQLFYDAAPRHVENFIQLAEEGFYDNLSFHRIVPGYLIQGGAPGDDPAAIHPDGRLLEPEFNEHKFIRGTVGMARLPSDPGTASCQFFICFGRWPELDGQYTAFGELVGEESYSVLEKLMSLPSDANNKPLKKAYIRTIRIQDMDSAGR